MKPYYHGFVIYFRARPDGAGFGFIYCLEQDNTYFFSERSLAKEQATPQVGEAVDFRGGTAQAENKEPLATSVKSSQVTSTAEGSVSLAAAAQVYRQPVSRLRQLLGSTTAADTHPERISIAQLLTVADLVAGASEKPRKQVAPRRIGQVVRYREENGYGFIEQSNQEDVFVHVRNAAPNALASGAWVVFTQGVHPHDPTKLRATHVKALANEASFLQANLSTFPDATLRTILEHGPAELHKPIVSQELARIDDSCTFEQAKQVLTLAEKYLPQTASPYRELIGQRLTGAAAWYWWQRYGDAEAVPEGALSYYNESASELTGDAENGFDLQGTLLLQQLNLAHFMGLFRTRWSYARVLESVETEGAQHLLEDCRYLSALDAFIYGSAILSPGHSEDTQKAMWLMRYFASLDVEGLAEAIWKSSQIILPIPAFVSALPTDTETYYLMPLLAYSIPAVGAVVAPQLFQRLGTVETEDAFAQLVELLKLCRKSSDDALVALATQLALQGCSPFFQVKLWTLELIPGADIYQLLEGLSSSKIRAYLQDAYVPVRLPAATILLLRAAEMENDASMRQGIRVLRESRQLLANEDFELLKKVYPAAGNLYAEVNSWLDSQQPRPAYSTLLTWLLVLHEEVPTEMVPLINHLATEERGALLHHVVDIDSARLLGLNSGFLVQWLLLLEEGTRLDIKLQLAQSRRNDLLLDLWLGGHSEYFDFARYYLLVATIAREKQFLFLRKVFGLMASGSVQLTVDDLDSIPRHSRDDDNPLNRRLDYSIDLVLRVLAKLKRNSAYPGENDIVDCLIDYAGNSTKELLQFSHLFADCPGRTTFKYGRPQEIKRVFAVIGSKTYAAAPDKSYILAGEEKIPVVQNAIVFNDKRYPIKWKIEDETYWPWSYVKEESNGNRNVTCCEGKRALAVDKVTENPFWWCFGRPCHKANQKDSLPEQWQQYVLKDFIQIAGLRFDEEAYYRIIGLINRINELLTKLYCKECGTMLRPSGTSEFNFYRVTKFNCTVDACSSRGKIIYLNRCLNSNCGSVIDSRVSVRCNYDDLGHFNWSGMYICDNCGGCCSKNKLQQQVDKLKQIYGVAVKNNRQYNSLVRQIELKLYHADHFKSYCHKCLTPMKKDYAKSDYYCPQCDRVKYAYPVAYLTVYNRNRVAVVDEQEDF